MNKKTLVLGASVNPTRYAYMAIQKLLEKKHTVLAIGNKSDELFGVKIHTDKVFFEEVDTVTMYLGPKNQLDYYNYIVSLKPNRVIFNPGTENPEFEKILKGNSISFERACTLVLLSIGQY